MIEFIEFIELIELIGFIEFIELIELIGLIELTYKPNQSLTMHSVSIRNLNSAIEILCRLLAAAKSRPSVTKTGYSSSVFCALSSDICLLLSACRGEVPPQRDEDGSRHPSSVLSHLSSARRSASA